MAIEHSAVDVELPVGCRRSVEAWKAAHCCSEPGERQEASIEASEYTQALSLPSRDRGRSREM